MVNALRALNIHQVLRLILVLSQVITSNANSSNRQCTAASCGEIHSISYLFRLKSDPKGCGDSKYELACEDNHTVLYFSGGQYYVQSINYSNGFIKLVNDGLQKDNCLSLPHHSLVWHSYKYPFDPFYLYFMIGSSTLVIVNCSKPVSSPYYITTSSCIEGLYSSNTSSNWNSYALYCPKASDVRDFCTINSWTWISADFRGEEHFNISSYNYKRIHRIMANGFVLGFRQTLWKSAFFCSLKSFINERQVCGSNYYIGGVQDDIANWMTGDLIVLLVKFIIATPFIAIYLIYKYRRRHLAMDRNIEEFLQAQNDFWPIRYSYSNIKKITGNFKHKLGEGGYGSVYKGRLRSGKEVAIKILKQSKTHDHDFISEVATIGRIHHVNVVQLIGFCFEGSKQALIYDLMTNGSLDKHIFNEEVNNFLNYRKIYEIALGVARGIEYLHRGCDMQILHFDIKPHNILLDNNFTPKVSDFGLAKLYPNDCRTISLTTVRGTLGYMAPELFYRNIGGVSYKADIYSFGKLLMEMAGRRKNINANAEHSSQIYFPLWVYDQVNDGKIVEWEDVVEEERNVMQKMILVALWCIQLSPDHRPAMSKVLEMLEGDIGNLQMPPKPLIYPPDVPIDNDKIEVELEAFPTSSSTLIISASLPIGDKNGV